MLLFFLFCQTPLLSLPIVAGFMVWWGLDGGSYQLFGVRFATQMFALLALPFLYIRTNTRLRINKWVFYLFYPALWRSYSCWIDWRSLPEAKNGGESAHTALAAKKNCAPGRDIPGRFSVLNFHVPWLRGLLFQRPAITVGHVVDQTDHVFGAGGVQLDLRDAIALRSVFRQFTQQRVVAEILAAAVRGRDQNGALQASITL